MNLDSTIRFHCARVQRINNPAPVDGPEIYETRDDKGNIEEQFDDEAGAEESKRKKDRKRFKLGKESKALKEARDLRDGKTIILDNRQRVTTGGTGGTGGPGNG
jgi:hypothetical protein